MALLTPKAEAAMGAALDRVASACRANSKFLVTTVGDRQEREYSRNLFVHGVKGLEFATDALVLFQALKRMVDFTE
jgi:hypothetical protein